MLELFNANPELFDVIFVANATAGIKLVADGFCGFQDGFEYTYLRDVHTSLVGVSGLARERTCLSEREIEGWLNEKRPPLEGMSGLFAYPAQSNFNGRRFPLDWIRQLRKTQGWYSLLDAASYLTTTPLDYSDPSNAPDFTVLSFYKIFGYPDLGALIVRRDAGHILLRRRYFGGGTRAAITADSFHAPRKELHEALEDGTLPFHTILALDSAFRNYSRIYGNQMNISRHATLVSQLMYTLLSSLRHDNGRPVCQLYSFSDHGPIVAFNLLSSKGTPVGYASFEKLSSLRNIALRTGGMCNPGGVEQYLDLQSWDVERNFGEGKVCGDDMDVVGGKNTGVIRVSFGACSTIDEVCAFVDFIREFYVEKEIIPVGIPSPQTSVRLQSVHICTSNSWMKLILDPIKSCHAYSIPEDVPWPVTSRGLLYDREFFLISTATGRALSQKQYPRMALIRPSINLSNLIMSVFSPASPARLEIPLDTAISVALSQGSMEVRQDVRVCADKIRSVLFTSPHIQDFFSAILDVQCTLAMYHPENAHDLRFFKSHLPESQKMSVGVDACAQKREIWLSNESPYLLISQSSVDALSRAAGRKEGISPAVFRPNFVLGGNEAYSEDGYRRLRIGSVTFDVLGPCRRCHMVCVDPERGVKEKEGSEVYLGLGKTRRKGTGGVVFGVHMGLSGTLTGTIKVGDEVIVEELVHDDI